MIGRFLLDTNIPSELMRLRPEAKVQQWIMAQEPGTLFLSVVSLGELESGFTAQRDAERRKRLQASLDRFLSRLPRENLLPLTRQAAIRWGEFEGRRRLAGRPLSSTDGQIAATAFEHGFALVTRNVRDFENLGLSILNPWDA